MRQEVIVNGPPLGRIRSSGSRGRNLLQIHFWEYAPWVAITMVALVGVRIHEPIPPLRSIRPVLLAIVLGMGPLLVRSGIPALRSALSYPVSKILVAYFLWVAATVPLAIWPGYAFGVWTGLIGPILMYMAVILCRPTRKTLDRVLWGVVLATCLYLIINLAQRFGPSGAWRLTSRGSYDANDMAGLFAAVFPLAVGLTLRSRGLSRVLALVGSGLLMIGLAQTGSRGGAVAMVAGSLVLVLGQRGVRLFGILLAFSVGTMVVWQTSSNDFRERMRTFTALSQDYNMESEMGRVEIWKRSAKYFVQNPVLGVGAGNFPMAEGAWLRSESRAGKWSTTHNAYLQAAAELGAVGGLLFITILLKVGLRAKEMWRVRRKTTPRPVFDRPEMLASLVAVATAAVFLSLAYSWLVFAVTAWVSLADRVRTAETYSFSQHPNARVS